MIKSVISITVVTILILILTACGNTHYNEDSQGVGITSSQIESTNTVQTDYSSNLTGYPSGQIQTEMIFCQDNLYVLEDMPPISTLPEDYILYGEITATATDQVPDEDLFAAHLPVNTTVYTSEKDPLHVYVYYTNNETYRRFIRSDQIENWWSEE